MFLSYDLSAPRGISAANTNYYRSPVLHPDRIMKDHDLIYLLDGSWEILQDGVPYRMEPGDVLLLHAGRHHWGRSPCTAGTRTLFLHLSPAPGDAVLPSGTMADGLPPLLHCTRRPAIRFLFERIIRVFHTEAFHPEEKLSSLTQLLLWELSACAPREDRQEQADRLLQGVIQRILFEPQRRWTARELALASGVSERTLRDRFHRAYQMTPCQYQQRYKLEQAAQMLLLYPDMPLAAVAENLGFCDEFHLSRVFKQRYGLSPRSYRQRRKSTESVPLRFTSPASDPTASH